MRFYASFTGRKKGAIGISQQFTTHVEADSKEAAELALYDRFDHIMGLQLTDRGPHPIRQRFADDWKMPYESVEMLVDLAKQAGKCKEHVCNGDPVFHIGTDIMTKADNAREWQKKADDISNRILELVAHYGFTGIEYTGLGPTLKRGQQFVEVPY